MSNNNKKTLATIKADSAHRGNGSHRHVPVTFKPLDEAAEGDKGPSVKIKVTEDYSQTFDPFDGGNHIEPYLKHFQQLEGIFEKQRLRETSEEHQEAYEAAEELLKAHLELKPDEEEGAKDDDEADSSSDESSDSESDDDRKKKKPTKKLNKIERWTLRRKKMKRRMIRSKKLITKQVEKAFDLQNSLFSVEQRVSFQKIMREVCYQSYENVDGDLVKPRGITWESFRIARVEYMLTVCKKDAAEQQRYYLMWAVQKPYGLPYRTFQARMLTINSYLPLLPCLKDSDMATDATVRMNVSISEHDMANLLLRACNAEWEAQWTLVNTYLPSSMRGFLSKMEAIEQVMETQAIPRRHRLANGNQGSDKATSSKWSDKATSSKSTSKGGQREGNSNTEKQKHCQLCQEHGGKAHTHNTKDCRRYSKEGKERADFGAKGNRKFPSGKPSGSSERHVSKKSYKQMKKRAEKAEAKVRKRDRSRDSSRDRRHRRKRDYYSDSDSGSESDY